MRLTIASRFHGCKKQSDSQGMHLPNVVRTEEVKTAYEDFLTRKKEYGSEWVKEADNQKVEKINTRKDRRKGSRR